MFVVSNLSLFSIRAPPQLKLSDEYVNSMEHVPTETGADKGGIFGGLFRQKKRKSKSNRDLFNSDHAEIAKAKSTASVGSTASEKSVPTRKASPPKVADASPVSRRRSANVEVRKFRKPTASSASSSDEESRKQELT